MNLIKILLFSFFFWNSAFAAIVSPQLPSQSGQSGKFLTTNGSVLSWGTGGGGGSGTVTSVAMTVPAFLSVAGSPITTSGTLAVSLSGTALPILNGGTGQTTANAAFNALAPSQTGQSGKFLTTNGTNTSWATVSASPAGNNTNVQFNNSGSFGGSDSFVWDNSAFKLSVTSPGTSGMIGINQTPSHTLDVSMPGGDFAHIISQSGGAFVKVEASGGTPSLTLGAQSGGNSKVGTESNDSFSFQTNNIRRVLLDTSGNTEILSGGTLKLDGSSSGFVGLKGAAAAGSTTYTLPTADGSSGQFLQTNGSGILSWQTASGGGGATTALDNLASVAINTPLVFASGTVGGVATADQTDTSTDSDELDIHSGALTNPSTTAVAGHVYMYGGDNAGSQPAGGVSTYGGTNSGSSNGGDAEIGGGESTGSAGHGGHMSIFGGDSANGAGGNVLIYPGAGTGGTFGKLRFQNANEGTAGQCWTSTDTQGSGHWAPCATGTPSDFIFSNSYGWSLGTGTPANHNTLAHDSSSGGNAAGVVFGSTDITAVASSSDTGTVYLVTGDITDSTSNGAVNSLNIMGGSNFGTAAAGSILISGGNIANASSGSGPGSIQIAGGATTGSANGGSVTISGGIAGGAGNGGGLALSGGSGTLRGEILVNNGSHIAATGASPSFVGGDCGTSPTITGNDVTFKINIGTGGTDSVCSLTFAQAWQNNPVCLAQDETTGVVLLPAASTTGLVIMATNNLIATPFGAADVVSVHCFGLNP